MSNIQDLEGLCASPEPMYLYVDLGKDQDGTVYGWHTYDPNSDKATPIYQPAVMGKLINIKLQIREFQQKENMKADFRIQSGSRTWIIRSGVETVFTRGVVLGLAVVEDLSKPVKIHAAAGETSVLGNVYNEMNYRYVATWDTEVKLFPIIQKLQEALGHTPQQMKDIRDEFDSYKRR